MAHMSTHRQDCENSHERGKELRRANGQQRGQVVGPQLRDELRVVQVGKGHAVLVRFLAVPGVGEHLGRQH